MYTGSGWRHPALRNLILDHQRFVNEGTAIRSWVEDSLTHLTPEEIISALGAFWELHGVEHLREEEEILFPICRQHIPEFGALESLLRSEHDQTRGLVADLLSLSPLEPAFMVKIGQIQQAVATHNRFEERVVFPLISEKLTEAHWEEYTRLSRDFRLRNRPPDAHWDQPTDATDDNA